MNRRESLGIEAPGLEIGKGALVGATLTGVRADGAAIEFEVRAGRPGSAAHGLDDVWFYDVFLKEPEGTRPYCGTTADGGPVSAIALAGQWNPQVGVKGGGSRMEGAGGFTFACRGYALAKCVEWGYKPWVTHPKVGSLADYHQACVRLVTADYCGDGRVFTRKGTWVNLYDAVGIQNDTLPWLPEAEWTVDGAVCLNHRRRGNEFPWPDCFAKQTEAQRKACGDPRHFSKRVLLISEHRPPGSPEPKPNEVVKGNAAP